MVHGIFLVHLKVIFVGESGGEISVVAADYFVCMFVPYIYFAKHTHVYIIYFIKYILYTCVCFAK